MKAGDHILIPRPGGAEHAIDVGDRTAIVFEPGRGPRRVRLGVDGDRPAVVTHVERAYAPKQVVARAFSRFSESAFSAMFASSEAFAVWCKTGRLPVAAPAAAPSATAVPTRARRSPAAPAAPAKGRKNSRRPAGRARGAPAAKKLGKKSAAPRSAAPAMKRPASKGKRPAAARPAAPKAGARRKTKAAPKRSAAARARARARGR